MTRPLTLTLRLMIALALAIMSVSNASGAHIDTLSIDTRLLPSAVRVTVVVPDRASAGESCNTVYLLNGYTGDHTQWLKTQPRLPELADRYGIVMVMPDGMDSWYWDAPADPTMKMESFIIDQLVPYIDTYYPTRDDRKHRAVTGLSMGGHGALWLAGRHPEVFGNAGSMSGAVDISGYVGKYKTSRLLGDKTAHRQRWTDYSVISLVPSLTPGSVNIIIDCGADDPFAGINRQLHQALSDKGVPHDYTSRPGAHTPSYWANSILYHLLFFKEAFDK